MFRNTFRDLGKIGFLIDGSFFTIGLDAKNWNLLAVALIVLLLVGYLHEKGIHIREAITRQHLVFRWIIYITAVLVILVFGKYGPDYNEANFIYGQF